MIGWSGGKENIPFALKRSHGNYQKVLRNLEKTCWNCGIIQSIATSRILPGLSIFFKAVEVGVVLQLRFLRVNLELLTQVLSEYNKKYLY